MPFSSTQPLTRLRQRVLDTAVDRLDSNWEDVLLPYGAALAGQAWSDPDLITWARTWLDRHLEFGIRSIPNFRYHDFPKCDGILLNDYCGLWGMPLVSGALTTGDVIDTHRAAVRSVCDHILEHAPRLEGGVIAHGGSDYCRRTVWVDTLFYTASVLAAGYRITGNEAYAAEAVKQCRLHTQWLQDPTTGCFFHDAEPATGRRSAWFWSRGNGWIILSLVDTLRSCAGTPGCAELLDTYRTLSTGLLRLQHPTGLWRIVPEREESHLETSGSAMILAGLAAGVTEGWLEPSTARQVTTGWNELQHWIVPDTGALVGAQFPAGLGGWETHKLSGLGERTYATGLFLRLAAELASAGLPAAFPESRLHITASADAALTQR